MTAPFPRVLLIEDNPGQARLIRIYLADAEGQAVSIAWANRLAQGLAILADEGADVVLLDLSLPDSQGMATLTRVRDHAPRVPIIVLSGLDDDLVATEAVRQGAHSYLCKDGIDGAILARQIRQAVADS